MSIELDDIANCGMKHGLQAPAMIEAGWGRDVAALWLGGLLSGLSASAEVMLGSRGAYDLFQAAADGLAAKRIEIGDATAS